MTTGDLKNNLRKLHSELKLVNYCGELDIEGLSIGKPSAFLPILHFVLADFSLELAQYFYSKDYELLGKSDMKFVQVVYRILRDEFNAKAALTRDQFFTLGFAERKLQLVTSVVHLCRKKSEDLKPRIRKTLARKMPRNKLYSVLEKTSENSEKAVVSKQITMDTISTNFPHLSTLDSGHATQASPVLPNNLPMSNGVMGDINCEAPSDDIPRNVPIARKYVAEHMPRYCWPTIGENTRALMGLKNSAVSSKENIPANDQNETNVQPSSLDKRSHLLGNLDDSDTMLSPIPLTPRYTFPKERTSFYDEEKPVYPRDIYVNQTSKDKGNTVALADNDLATYLEKLTTRQDRTVILEHFSAQQNRIEELERDAARSSVHFQELAKRSSELSARVMVLETAVTLLQEKIE